MGDRLKIRTNNAAHNQTAKVKFQDVGGMQELKPGLKSSFSSEKECSSKEFTPMMKSSSSA